MKLNTKESGRLIDAVLKALDVLDCFGDDPTLTLKQIIDRTGLGRSRAMRLTGTLISRGYLFFDPVTGHFSLGSRLMALGDAFNRNNNIIRIARPIMKYLVDKTGESSTFSIIEADERVILVREEGTHAIRYSIQEGQRMPLHAGAASKALLAFGPQDVLERLITADLLQPITSSTVTDPEQLKNNLARIRKQGFAVSLGENTPGARAIAAPVFNYDNHLAGVVSVSGPANRIEGSIIDRMINQVLEASHMLSKALGRKEPDVSNVQLIA